MTLQTGQQIITMHKLSNISRIKGNQARKFDHTQNVVKKLVPDPFIQKSKLNISLDQVSFLMTRNHLWSMRKLRI